MDGWTRIPAVMALLAVAVTTSSACDARGNRPGPAVSSVTAVVPGPTVLPTLVADPGAPDLGPFTTATLTVPPWGAGAASCPAGRLRLGDGGQYVGTSRVVNLLSLVVSDVDGDGRDDYVAFLMCGEGPESPGWQVVAFRRTADHLAPIGRVVGSQDGFAMMSGLQAKPDGRIAANVAELYTDSGEQYVPHQWRTYAWQGGRFRQVEGPTSFPAQPPAARLSVDRADLVLRPAPGGGLFGEMTVTVRNTGDGSVPNAFLMFMLPPEIGPAGVGWAGCTMATFEAVRIDCPLGPLAAQSSRTLTVAVVASGRPRLTGRDEPGQYQPSNHYLSIGQQAPYALEVAQDHEADILITAP